MPTDADAKLRFPNFAIFCLPRSTAWIAPLSAVRKIPVQAETEIISRRGAQKAEAHGQDANPLTVVLEMIALRFKIYTGPKANLFPHRR
jgi:hypothetical protein